MGHVRWAVSNLHTAERIVECSPDVFRSEAPWRIELPQGGVVRGTQDQVGTWPAAFDGQPSSARILRLSESGKGRVLENNLTSIHKMLAEYNDTVPGVNVGRGESDGGTSGGGSVSTSGSASGGSANGGSSGGDAGMDEPVAMTGGGCSANPGQPRHTALGLLFLGLLTLWVLRSPVHGRRPRLPRAGGGAR